MKKILVIDSWSGFGGGQRVAHDLLFGLKSRQEFVYMAPAGPYVDACRSEGIETNTMHAKSFLAHVFEIRNVIQETSPDIIHAHGTRAAVWTRIALMTLMRKPKLIYTLHGFHLIHKNGIGRWILLRGEKFLNRSTDVLVCVSKHDRETLKRYSLIDPKKIQVIYNGIDLSYWQTSLSRHENSFARQDTDFVIAVIGRLHEPKDIATVLRAFAMLKSSTDKSCSLVIVGDGPQRFELEQLAKELCIDKQTCFVGNQKEVRPFLKRCDVAVVSSKWEGLCMAVLEASAMKKPVIVSEFYGVEEVMQSEKTGLLFPVGSDERLKEQLKRLMDSPELGKQLGASAFSFVQERFSFDRMLTSYQQLYESID